MRDNFIYNSLLENGEAIWKPQGNSMTPKINSGEEVELKSCEKLKLYVNDIVYCKVKSNYYLHLLSAIEGERYQISNNHGYVNGWINRKNIFGICVRVKDKVLLSVDELKLREETL
jgi:hypothetical protein